ncbi:MAG TPA: ISL3 family transposase [Azospirillum sp.]|nr:ISL3 family transposase [Azospirillum sp.]
MPDLLDLHGLLPVARRVDEKGQIIITVEGRAPAPPRCCLFQDLRKNGRKTVLCRDHPMQNKPVWLEVKRQRYKCAACGAVLYDNLPELDPDRRVTERFRHRLGWDAVEHTFATAAKMNGVEETFVRRVFAEFAKERLAGYTVVLPSVLGMDENVLLGKARFVIGDIKEKRLLDLRETRLEADLDGYFEQMHGRDNVDVVCQDMWRGYRNITKRHFPKAVTVIDKFHVVRLANYAVESARKALYNGLTNDERKHLKRRNRLLLARWAVAKESTKAALTKMFDQYPSLAAAYWHKERFFDIYESETRAEAEAATNRWQAEVPAGLEDFFKPVRTALSNWRPYILRYFEHRYTNAYVETVNGLIGEMNRRGRGYNFEVLRAKVLLKYGNSAMRLPDGSLWQGDYGFGFFEPDAEGNRFVGLGADLSTLMARIEGGRL